MHTINLEINRSAQPTQLNKGHSSITEA